jgi:hypothetical protein
VAGRQSFNFDAIVPFENASRRSAMTPTALLTFVLIAGLVWGGLAVIIGIALRSERHKAGEG